MGVDVGDRREHRGVTHVHALVTQYRSVLVDHDGATEQAVYDRTVEALSDLLDEYA